MSTDTASENSVEYRTCPWPVKFSGWIFTFWAGLMLVLVAVNIFAPVPDFQVEIYKYKLNNHILAWRIVASAIMAGICIPVIGLSVSLLRGRMWAYYTTVLIWIYLTGSYVVNHLYYDKPLRIGNLNFVIDLVLTIAFIGSFDSYRKMIKYRRSTPPAAIQEPDITTP